MARGDVRIGITLACEECKRRNYQTNKSKRNDPEATVDFYIEDQPTTNMAATAITTVGGSQPHTNFQPYLCVNYILSLFGIFPSPT